MDEDRFKKLDKIRQAGVNPYPGSFKKDYSLMEAKALKPGKKVKVAGRMMMFRDMGKLTFAHLQDFSGRMQIVFELKEMTKEKYDFLKFLDLGDILGIEGEIFVTQKGETSVLVKKYQLLSKSLRQLPEKWHGLKDKETAYRQRYLDLMSNRETMERFVFRSNFIRALREFYWQEGFYELECPYLGSTASGALAKPFVTHHNALDHDFYLRIAIETYQKEATVGGFEKTFEIGKVFRNEGIDPSHLQEFTMCEHYAVYWDYEDNMKFTEKMLHHLLKKTMGSEVVKILDRDGNPHEIDFGKPWRKVSMREIILEDSGIDVSKVDTVDDLLAMTKKKGIVIEGAEKLGLGNLIDHLYKKVSRPKLIQPTFLIEHPVELSPLSRRNDKNPKIVDRFQLVVSGWEIINAYSEIVDPVDQAQRFEEQSKAKGAGDEDAHGKDEEFVAAMEYGMPPQSGWGMGIDRIIALLTQQDNLKDTVLFPLMRPPEMKHHQHKAILVIGEIISHVPHKKKTHINICQVDLGHYGMKTIVCAAPNVRDGLKVVVSLPGFPILDYTGTGKVAYVVEERKTYDTLSEAVMCAPEEIGVKETDPEKQKLIVEMDPSVENGTPYETVADKIISA